VKQDVSRTVGGVTLSVADQLRVAGPVLLVRHG
jgi:hypothetical protein